MLLWNSIILSLSTLYAAMEIKKHTGLLSACVFTLAIFGFAQPYLPSTLTATLGLALALIAFGALLRSARLRSTALFVVGLALLSFALNARAGCYFVLLAVWFWGVVYLGRNWRERTLAGVLGALALVSGTAYSLLLIKVFGNGEALTYNANFADTLYGLAVGGKGWHYSQVAHPELYHGVDAAERARVLFTLAFQEIAKHPLRFIGVYLDAIRDALLALAHGPALRFIDGHEPYTILAPAFKVMYAIGNLGLIVFAFNRRNALILLSLIGFYLSIPFIWQDGGLRVLASTIPFVFFALALGMHLFGLFFEGRPWRGIRASLSPPETTVPTTEPLLFTVPTAVLLGVALVPFALGGRFPQLAKVPPKTSHEAACPKGTTPLDFSTKLLMYTVRVHSGTHPIHGWTEDLSFDRLQSTLSKMHIESLFRHLPAPYSVFGVISGYKSHRGWTTVVWPGVLKDLDSQNAWYLCVDEFPHEFTGYSGHVYRVVRSR